MLINLILINRIMLLVKLISEWVIGVFSLNVIINLLIVKKDMIKLLLHSVLMILLYIENKHLVYLNLDSLLLVKKYLNINLFFSGILMFHLMIKVVVSLLLIKVLLWWVSLIVLKVSNQIVGIICPELIIICLLINLMLFLLTLNVISLLLLKVWILL